MKPTVSDQGNLLDWHRLPLTHWGSFPQRRAALGAGQAHVSQTRSASFPTKVKDVVTRAAGGHVSHQTGDLAETRRSTGHHRWAWRRQLCEGWRRATSRAAAATDYHPEQWRLMARSISAMLCRTSFGQSFMTILWSDCIHPSSTPWSR